MVVGPSGTEHARATFAPVGGKCHLELSLEDGRRVSADEIDYFECLLSVRRQLEHQRRVVICQGARRDVWPSGMARDMGVGLRAYVLTVGKHPTQDDVVEIFDPAEQSSVGTVAEQEHHFEEWQSSQRAFNR